MRKAYNCPMLDIKTFDTELLTNTSANLNPFKNSGEEIKKYSLDAFTVDSSKFTQDSTWNN